MVTISAGMEEIGTDLNTRTLRYHPGESSGQAVLTISAGMEKIDTDLNTRTLRCHHEKAAVKQ